MNEDHKKRGLTHSKLLTAVAISSLLLSSGNVMAAQANPDKSLGVTEQLQAITISGLVVDAAGEPIIGASVVEKGTTNGGITDLDGKFTLTITPGATLKISFVGYQTQEVKAAKTMRITLKEDTEMLDEVVVVGYKLWIMLTVLFGAEFMPGRDSFYALLRQHRLMLPARKTRHTTNSNHRYHKWKNLIKGLTLTSANQLWVSDITYIPLANGEVCYLHLITDAYSHKIVGWVLADTLRVSATINALQQAIEQAVEMTGDENLTGLIHHSDRGVQYCCDPYVALLQKHGIAISMTEDYKPTDNAVAERINGIIKAESSHPRGRFNDIGHARNVIARYIHFYNHRRPHMSIGYKIPAVAHLEKGIQKKMWKKKKYPSTSSNKKKDAISLQSRTASPGEGAGQRT